ncbi:unnamed protein product [Diatraea saccharalis]|uniref:Uncharacterized protein n=1 Tax=Diatraea saccharalis TaxID=40085 RepID=A0A9N9QPA0_9NEOP|nr:unnamed protein product [Diatraea saccharalis]
MIGSPQITKSMSGNQSLTPIPSPRTSIGNSPKITPIKMETKPQEWGPDMDRFWDDLTGITNKLSKALEVLESQTTLRKDTKEKIIMTLRKTKEKSKKMENTAEEIRSYIEQQKIRYGKMERDLQELKKEEEITERIAKMEKEIKEQQEDTTTRLERIIKEMEEKNTKTIEYKLREIEEKINEGGDEWNRSKKSTNIIKKLKSLEDNLTAEIIDVGRRIGEKIEDSEMTIKEKIDETNNKIENYTEIIIIEINDTDKETHYKESTDYTPVKQRLNEVEQHLNNKITHAREEVIAEIRHQIKDITIKNPSVNNDTKEIAEHTSKKLTYAEVIRDQNIKVPKTLHSVIISSTNPMDMSEDIIQKAKKKINAKQEGIKVDRLRKCKDARVIIGCEEKQQIRTKEEKLKQEKGFKVEKVKNKDPLVILKDVFNDINDDDLLIAIKEQNKNIYQGLPEEDTVTRIKFKRSTRSSNTIHVALQVRPALWQRMTGAGHLHIDLQRVRVEDQSPVIQCTKCLEFGHGRKFCTASASRCSHCGGSHLRTDCPDKEDKPPRCCNCSHSEMQNVAHNAFSRECPVRAKWDFLARATTAYS